MNEGIVRFLNELIQLELAGIRSYEQALEGAESVELRAQLTSFMGEHHRHVRNLSALVAAYGGRPVEEGNLGGALLEGMTAIVAMGDNTALLALRVTEEITNRTYNAALRQPLPEQVRVVLVEHLLDEKKHLTWILTALRRSIGMERPR